MRLLLCWRRPGNPSAAGVAALAAVMLALIASGCMGIGSPRGFGPSNGSFDRSERWTDGDESSLQARPILSLAGALGPRPGDTTVPRWELESADKLVLPPGDESSRGSAGRRSSRLLARAEDGSEAASSGTLRTSSGTGAAVSSAAAESSDNEAGPAPTDLAVPHACPPVGQLLARCREAQKGVRDATYVLHEDSSRDGEKLPYQIMQIKLRAPDEVYMTWIGETHQGREVIYRRGWNEGNLLVNAGRLVPTMSFDPQGSWALADTRHPVWMASILRAAERITTEDAWLTRQDTPNGIYDDLEKVDVKGRECHCYVADLPKDQAPQLYADRVEICIDTETWLPRRVRAWEKVADGSGDAESGELTQVEDYLFDELKTNVGLADFDFDPENPDYGF